MNSLMNTLLFWLSGWLRCRLIKVHNRPYLERYYIGSPFGRHVYLHRFLASDDPAQGVHDHPWDWSLSLIICGAYTEQRRWKTVVKRWLNYIGGDHFHLVLLIPRLYTWSIFIAGTPKPGRVWGMLRQLDADSDRGDVQWAFIPYQYGEGDNNPPPGKWWETEARGRFQQRERRTYVREQG
jgi:hypothetical protein